MKRRGLSADLIVMQKKRNDERRKREEERRQRKFAELSQQSIDDGDNGYQEVVSSTAAKAYKKNSYRNIDDVDVDISNKMLSIQSQKEKSLESKFSGKCRSQQQKTVLTSTMVPVKNIGSFIHKTSPDSSVSMSQQSYTNMNNNLSSFGKQSYRKRSRFTNDNDNNSDSDDDDNLLEQALMLDKRKKQKLDKESEEQRRREKEQQQQQTMAEMGRWNLDESKQIKNYNTCKNRTCDSSDSDDDDYLTKMARALEEKRKQQSTSYVDESVTIMQTNEVENKSKTVTQTMDVSIQPQNNVKAPNPIQSMSKYDAAKPTVEVKENENNENSMIRPTTIDNRKLWKNSEKDVTVCDVAQSNKSNFTPHKSKKVNTFEKNNNSNPKNRQQKVVITELSEKELEKLQHELKPNFANPKFGPFPDTEPIVLGDQYSIPISIARYLPDYQREGIRFLYEKGVAKQRGAILGDDMGLGKTIQTIGLLSALFKKKGTGMDKFELSRRNHRLETKVNQIEEVKEKALLSGHMFKDDRQELITLRDELHSEWAPVLIVCPNSVVVNWERDFQTWAHFSVAIYIGSMREEALRSIENGTAEVLVCAQSMIQSKRDFEALNSAQVRWKLIVIDEFHKVKNENTLTATNIKGMRNRHNSVLIGLTGTLMQNDHKELWTLVDICVEGFFDEWKKFSKEYARPIKLARTFESNLQTRNKGLAKSIEFATKIKEIFLRRTKEEVLADDLPQKYERIVFCEPSPLQKELYRYIIHQPDFKLLKEGSLPCDCGVNQKFFLEYQHLQTRAERNQYYQRNYKNIVRRYSCCYKMPRLKEGELDPKAVLYRQNHEDKVYGLCGKPGGSPGPVCPYCICLPALAFLLKLCSHASLLQAEEPPEEFEAGSKKRKEAENILERAETFIPDHLLARLPGGYIRNNSIMDDHFSLSGKMIVLDKLLRAISKQQGRVLLFSYSTKMLDLIQNFIQSKGFSFLRMDGQTSQKKREVIADQFNNRPDVLVFLLSTRAMGLGLNLTAANFVIIFDAEWNPASDEQAQDRAYRIGQTKDVKVFRLVSQGTLEELKYLRQVYKTQLKSETFIDLDDSSRAKRFFRGVAGERFMKGELFGMENLLTFKDGLFMNYSSRASESRQFGVGIHDTEKLIEEVNGLSEEEFAEIGSDGNVFDNLAIRKEEENKNDYCEEEYLGQWSQGDVGVYDKIQIPILETDTSLGHHESSPKSSEKSSESASLPQQLPTAATYNVMET